MKTSKFMFLHRSTLLGRSPRRRVHDCQWRPWQRCTFTWRHCRRAKQYRNYNSLFSASITGRLLYSLPHVKSAYENHPGNYQRAVVICSCQRFSLWMLRHLTLFCQVRYWNTSGCACLSKLKWKVRSDARIAENKRNSTSNTSTFINMSRLVFETSL